MIDLRPLETNYRCFVCEAKIILFETEIMLLSYATSDQPVVYFCKDCFDLELIYYASSADLRTAECALCSCVVIIKAFYQESDSELPKVYADVYKEGHFYRICKYCYCRDIALPLRSEGAA